MSIIYLRVIGLCVFDRVLCLFLSIHEMIIVRATDAACPFTTYDGCAIFSAERTPASIILIDLSQSAQTCSSPSRLSLCWCGVSRDFGSEVFATECASASFCFRQHRCVPARPRALLPPSPMSARRRLLVSSTWRRNEFFSAPLLYNRIGHILIYKLSLRFGKQSLAVKCSRCSWRCRFRENPVIRPIVAFSFILSSGE